MLVALVGGETENHVRPPSLSLSLSPLPRTLIVSHEPSERHQAWPGYILLQPPGLVIINSNFTSYKKL